MNNAAQYDLWLKRVVNDPDLRVELEGIRGDAKQIEDRFASSLAFGTGGLRGVIGAGTNRMNVYTIAQATQGYAEYLLSREADPSIAIAYDSRIKSELFAKTAAGVFAANGITVFIYPELMPTPALSFAVRHLSTSGGIVITASHNASKYNGYKVYEETGCQITSETAKAILKCIEKVDPFDGVRSMLFDKGIEKGKIRWIEDGVKEAYLNAVSALSLLDPSVDRSAKIAYTPLNGAGIQCVPDCLKRHDFTNLTIPDAQKDPDGNFPTCPLPNPELREALSVGIDWAKKHGCEMLLATDPDCDRVGVAVMDRGEYKILTGNQIGILLLDFVCRMRISVGNMPDKPVAVKTIVTSPMADAVAASHGVEMIDVLTGFKYIGEQINLLEKKGETERFLIGFEESCGYLSGAHVRDKDGVNAALLICEMFAAYKAKKMTLVGALERLYEKHGAYADRLVSYELEGIEGAEKIAWIMREMRADLPKEILGVKVDAVGNYLSSEIRYSDGREAMLDLPKSNVLKLWLENGSFVVVRPSGTEPKIKLYFSVKGSTVERCLQYIGKMEEYFDSIIVQKK